jgi:zinc/manganese transport system substrate-binding protein
VVVTTSVLGDIVENVAGRCAAVQVLMPNGADPHAYEPSARDTASLRDADLVVAFGLGLEESLEPVLDSAASDGTTVLELGPDLEPLALGGEDSSGAADDEGRRLDPHVWQDPGRISLAVDRIADALATHARCDPTDLDDRAAAYRSELEALEREIATLLQPIPADARRLVTNHDALAYFADRYGFEVVGTVVPGGSTLDDASSADLAALIDVIETTGVRAIFTENVVPADVAQAIADDVGHDVAVVELFTDALGEQGSEAVTYLEMMRTNARRIAEALMDGP